MKNKIMLTAAFGCAALAFTACGDEVTEQIVQSNSGLESVAAIDELPECTSENAGAMAFVSDSAKVYYCADSSWQLLNGKDGVDGVNGNDGEGCTVEKLKDQNGYKVICGGDSIGVVLNGANGTNGADGANGADGKPGEDGSDGTNGSAGAGCTAEALADNSGYKIICGDKVVGTLLNGQDGKPGEKGDTGETGAKGDDGKDGADGKSCNALPLKDGTGFTIVCGTDTVGTLLNGQKGDSGDQGIQGEKGDNGADGKSCNALPLKDGTGFTIVCGTDTVGTLLNGVDGKPGTDGINGATYYCGGIVYNPTTHFCKYDEIFALCDNGIVYEPKTEFCAVNGVVTTKCGGLTFDPTEEFCQTEIVYPRCGSDKRDYDGHAYKCEDGMLFSQCDAFDKETQVCYDGKIYGKCGDKLFDEALETCENGEVALPKCGGTRYNPSAGEECRDDVIFAPCGEVMINTTTETCEADTIYIRDTRDNRLYKTVTIGTQVWTAENMNYASSNSYCYDRSISNCDKYGRLYTWEATKSACPAGYHLPSDAEWDVLLKFVSADNNLGTTKKAGSYLKSKTGWASSSGILVSSDKYGFNGFPAGYYHYTSSSTDPYYSMGYNGYFWSSTEKDSTRAYNYYLYYNDEDLHGYYYDKTYALSVRCVKD